MIKIKINNQSINAEPGEMLISVTDREGITVPRFCYHKKLSVAANCRMCLVEVEGAPKPQPACSTPVSEGMKVHTENQLVKSSQQAVMEFLLINHPLDCPICDQGGECELQDVAMEYGQDISRFNEGKRIIEDTDIGALIYADMTRCIHCTRCVRFGTEIAGIMEMGSTGRGEHLKIEPFLTEGIQSELSGNMIDICPVGALTSKPFRYELRSWQMRNSSSIARHDLVGSNIYAQTYKGQVKRIVAQDNDLINETWISDRDRFSYQGLTHTNRLLTPKIKVEGQWQSASWKAALNFAAKGLIGNIINNHQSEQLGVLASNTATLEEYYLCQKLAREIGSDTIDYRLGVKNLEQPVALKSNISLVALETLDYALIVGSYTRLEQPLINHRLRKAVKKGAKIDAINTMAFDFNYQLNQALNHSPKQMIATLSAVLKTLLEADDKPIPNYLKNTKIDKNATEIAHKLHTLKHCVLILGEHLVGHNSYPVIANLIHKIAKYSNSYSLNLSLNNNAMAADLAGFKPLKTGLNANAMLKAQLKAYILLDVYSQFDFHNPTAAIKALGRADSFVICLNSFQDESATEFANVLLPIAACFETAGSQVNIEGKLQSFTASINPPTDAKPAWKVIKVLAEKLQLSGFSYTDLNQVTDEASHTPTPNAKNIEPVLEDNTNNSIDTFWQKSAYAVDALSRHAKALQQTKIGSLNNAWMNTKTAAKLALSDKDNYQNVPVTIADTVADNCVFVLSNQAKPWEEPE